MVNLRIPIISDFIKWRSMTNTDDPEHTFFKSMFNFSRAGVNVTTARAMQSSVVWRAVTLLSGTIASLPLPVYKRLSPRGKERDSGHSLYYKLHNRPNPEIASNVWRLMGISNQLLWGNWYNEIEFAGGYPVNLWPIPPWRVKPRRSEGGQLYYEVTLPNQSIKKIPPYAMWHVKNLYIDGDEGMSCLRAARESVGLGLAAEEFASRFFGDGANMGGIIEYPGKLSPGALENFQNSITEEYAGLTKAHKLLFLEEGLKYHQTAVPPSDGQMIESRKFQVADIGRFFFITQLHKLGDLERATFSNIEEQGIDFVVDTIQPLLVNIEQEMNHKLFYDAGSKEHFAEFLVDGLLRGNSASRAEFYNKIFNIGGFSVNDILELENRNPIGEIGDKRFVPMNMIPLDQIDDYRPKASGKPEPKDEKTKADGMEYRSGLSRMRIANSYKRLFVGAGQRVVRREKEAILKTVRELFNEDSNNHQAFTEWLAEYYQDKFPKYVKAQMLPVFMSLAEAMESEVLGEVDSGADVGEKVEGFVNEYTDSYIKKYCGDSQWDMTRAVQAALEGRTRDDNINIPEAIEEELNEWEEKRPERMAAKETVQLNGAVTRTILTLLGVTKLVVRNTGDKTCPFCEQLDGRVVGIEQPFLPAGSEIIASDGSGMKISGKKMNPPFHLGCVCTIEAGY